MALLLLLASVAFGGASTGAPQREMLIQCIALAALFVVLAAPDFRVGVIGRLPAAILLSLLLLVILQLIPLPAKLWAQLPGRELPAYLAQVSGTGNIPRPLTLDPDRTLSSALALLPGIAMFLTVASLETRGRLMVGWLIVVAAAISFVLGAIQASMGGEIARGLTLFHTSHTGQAIGVFANSNHQADLMLIGIVLAGCLAPPAGVRHSGSRMWLWLYGLEAAFAIGVIVTSSRIAILLLPVAILAILLRTGFSRRLTGILLSILALGSIVIVLAARNAVIATAFSQFDSLEDSRFSFWSNIIYAIERFQWAGSGIGTFDGVYRSVEALSTVGPSFVNHAHNDYLEIMLETGAFGLIILIVFIAFLLRAGIRILADANVRAGNALAYAGLTGIALIMLHSIVDYPLRTPLLSVVFGCCCGFIVRTPPLGSMRQQRLVNPHEAMRE